jgi:hypothetical protein
MLTRYSTQLVRKRSSRRSEPKVLFLLALNDHRGRCAHAELVLWLTEELQGTRAASPSKMMTHTGHVGSMANCSLVQNTTTNVDSHHLPRAI